MIVLAYQKASASDRLFEVAARAFIAFASAPSMVGCKPELETALTVKIVTGKRRFEALFQGGSSSYAVASYDRPLLAGADWLVAPTLGAIVPNWLLLIPRDPVLNFRAWSELHARCPEELLSDVRRHLGLYENEIIWFEHGPRAAGTST